MYFGHFLHAGEVNVRINILGLGLFILWITEISCVQGCLFTISEINEWNAAAHPQFYYSVLSQTKLSKLYCKLVWTLLHWNHHNFQLLARLKNQLSWSQYWHCRGRCTSGGKCCEDEEVGAVDWGLSRMGWWSCMGYGFTSVKTSVCDPWELGEPPGFPCHEALQCVSTQFLLYLDLTL